MASIVFLRISWYFLQKGLSRFKSETAKHFEKVLKIIMIIGYTIYFGMAIYRIVENVVVRKEILCQQPIFFLWDTLDVLVWSIFIVFAFKLRRKYKQVIQGTKS